MVLGQERKKQRLVWKKENSRLNASKSPEGENGRKERHISSFRICESETLGSVSWSLRRLFLKGLGEETMQLANDNRTEEALRNETG